MTLLGTALTFYAKYPSEMGVLYRIYDEDSKVYDTLLPNEINKSEIADLVDQVGKQSDKEIQIFLKKCTDSFLPGFNKICNFEPVSNNDDLITNWKIWAQGTEKNSKFWIGIKINVEENCLVAWPWIWIRGGRRQESELKRVLACKVITAKEAGAGWASGSVCFPPIPFKVPVDEVNFNADLLLKEITAPFLAITEKQIKDIFELIRNIK